MRAFFIVICSWLAVGTCNAYAGSLYDAVLKGKNCDERANQQRDCDYKIGQDFWLSIAAVGTSAATVHFMKSNFEGPYYASFLTGSGCVMISNGKRGIENGEVLNIAYVSPRTGNVYLDVSGCEAGS